MAWLRRVKLRREIVGEMKRAYRILEVKQFSVEMQMVQIDSRAKRSFSLPYRIKFLELLDILEKKGTLEDDLRKHNWYWILTGRKWKN